MLPTRCLFACIPLLCLAAAASLCGPPAYAQDDAGWADAGPSASEANSPGEGDAAQAPASPPPAREASETEALALAFEPQLAGAADTSEILAAILARPEFHEESAPAPQPTWLGQLFQRFMNWLSRLFTPLAGASIVVQVIAAIGMLLIGALLIYYIARLFWSLLAARRGSAAAKEPGDEALARPDELLAAARRALEAGDFRQALRLRFRALLASLDIAAAPLLTNRELAEQITEHAPATSAALAELIRIFEDAWYGGLRCEAQHYQRSDELARAVEERVRLARAEAGA